MHKYACAHDLTMKVMNQGNCPTDNLHVCSDQFLLQFPTRYLEWIMIAREHSIDPTTSLDFNARADGLTEDERKEILSWEFEYIDRDKNNVLDTAEIQDVFNDVLGYEPCLYGFLKSCDLNEKEGIEKREWDFCFPKTGTAFETRKWSYNSPIGKYSFEESVWLEDCWIFIWCYAKAGRAKFVESFC